LAQASLRTREHAVTGKATGRCEEESGLLRGDLIEIFLSLKADHCRPTADRQDLFPNASRDCAKDREAK
jgi:hypothetical protein